jgi:FkbM family methyltransferase
VSLKLKGQATACPWDRVWSTYSGLARFAEIYDTAKAKAAVLERDTSAGLHRVTTPKGPFWARQEGDEGRGIQYLFAEHDWIAESFPEARVRRGDIVVDVGAHIGVFVAKALELGAEKVVAVEPDPGNVECLRRNFPREVASGRVVIVPEGAWSGDGSLTLHIGKSSGWNSMIQDYGGRSIEVPVRKLDDVVRRLGLPRVDYIKMDIEGAEREALKGAMETLRSYRSRLLIDSYHRPDDPEVLPGIIRQAHADYRMLCGPCEQRQEAGLHLVPHVTFYW